MQIPVTIIISLIALIVSAINSFTGLRRNNKKEDKAEATQLTTVIVKLENIGNDIKDVKTDLKDVKSDIRNHSDRLVKVEQELEIIKRIVYNHEGT